MDDLAAGRWNGGMQTNTNSQILVVGGTGKTGRRVLSMLAAQGITARSASRNGDVRFDWTDESTWAAALDGVTSAYVTFSPDLAVPGADVTIEAFTALAVKSGVQRLVLLSGRGEEGARRCEEIVQAAGIEWTIVRAGWFQQNFSEDFLRESVLAGEIVLPAGHVAEPFIDVDDIAEIVVAALLEDRHVGELYEVTGPRLLTFADIATELTEALGRQVSYIPVTTEEFISGATEAGIPRDTVEMLAHLFTEVLDGRNAYLTNGVERALGRPARDFADYARAVAATGAWNPA
jgi:uncharacterized protein YbjT (DUF2867 family)